MIRCYLTDRLRTCQPQDFKNRQSLLSQTTQREEVDSQDIDMHDRFRKQFNEVPDLSGKIIIGQSPIAAGGFADVYRGTWVDNKTTNHPILAVKILRRFILPHDSYLLPKVTFA